MTAFSLGSAAFSGARARTIAVQAAGNDEIHKRAAANNAAPTREDGLSAIIQWVPGEVIGAYTAVVLALQANSQDPPIRGTGGVWLVMFCFGALIMTLLGGVLSYRKTDETGAIPASKLIELVLRGVLAAAAFFLWSYIIPGSATNQSTWGVANAAVIPALFPLLAIVFGLIAQFLVLPSTVGFITSKL